MNAHVIYNMLTNNVLTESEKSSHVMHYRYDNKINSMITTWYERFKFREFHNMSNVIDMISVMLAMFLILLQ